MQVESSDRIRNLAIAGHNGTGKTTLASATLFTSGAVTRMGKVEEKNTVTDFDPQEQHRTISIGAAVCYAPWRAHKVNLIDCPGYGIFFSETLAALRAADAVLLCVSGVAGVEVTTEKTWEAAESMRLPVVVALTKMDRERADMERALDSLRERLNRAVTPVQMPLGKEHEFSGVVDLVSFKAYVFDKDGSGKAREVGLPTEAHDSAKAWRAKLVEAVAEADDSLMEKYFDTGDLPQEDLERGLRQAILDRRLFPLVLTAGLHSIGTSALLDFLVDFAPSPAAKSFPASNIAGESLALKADPAAPLAALCFKTLSDPFTGKISILRVVTGTLAHDTPTWNVRAEEVEKVGHILQLQGKQGTQVPQVIAGDIAAVAKLKLTHSGDSLTAKERPLSLGWIQIPEPAIAFAIEPKAKGDEEKIGEALHRLMEEDLALRFGRDPQTGELLVSGSGQLHVEIAIARLRDRNHVEVLLHPPKVPYRETVHSAAEGHGRHKKQSGGRGQFADCRIKIEPLERGKDFEFVDEIFGGAIPQNYRPAVEKGIQEARQRGYLAGYPVVDFRVRLLDGQYHDVDSSELAFKIAGSLGFKDAMQRAKPTILEPMMKVEITTSDEFMGDIMSDLSQRRGRPSGMENKGHHNIITAVVPMAEMLNYAPALRAMTQGRSDFHMEYTHYEEVPRPVQDKLIAEAAKRRQEEHE